MSDADSFAAVIRDDRTFDAITRSVRGDARQKRARKILWLLAITSPVWIGACLFFVGLIATLVVPNVIQKYFQAASTKAKVGIAAIESAAKEFAINNGGEWPDDLHVLVVRDANGESYLDADVLPLDPWGRAYLYEPPRPGHPIPRIYTLGRDGVPGGEGEDADVENAVAR